MKKNFMLLFSCLFVAALYAETVGYSVDEGERFLKTVTTLHGPSGFEDDVRSFLIDQWREKTQDIVVDNLGNVFFFVNGKRDDNSKPTVVLMAHMDEIGLMVKSITDEGYLKVEPLGACLDYVLITQNWIIKTEQGYIVGYSGLEAPHIHGRPVSEVKLNRRKMFIDIGAKSKEEAEKMGIRPGLSIAPYPVFEKIGLNQTRYLAKAFDDRVCFAVIDQVLHEIAGKELDVNFVIVATVQEEVYMRGAHVVADTIRPDIVLNLEASMSTDFPLQLTQYKDGTSLGKGPAIFVFDGSMIPDQKLLSYLIALSKDKEIVYQYDSMFSYGQDGAAIQKKQGGVSTINIGVPCRYAHSTRSVVDRFDIEETAKLLTHAITDLNRDKVNIITQK